MSESTLFYALHLHRFHYHTDEIYRGITERRNQLVYATSLRGNTFVQRRRFTANQEMCKFFSTHFSNTAPDGHVMATLRQLLGTVLCKCDSVNACA